MESFEVLADAAEMINCRVKFWKPGNIVASVNKDRWDVNEYHGGD